MGEHDEDRVVDRYVKQVLLEVATVSPIVDESYDQVFHVVDAP